MMKDEGLDNIYLRHTRLASGLRSAIKAIGLKPFVEDENIASTSITSILPPDGISVADIRKDLKDDFDIVVADGQNKLKGKIFRMGTLGFVSERDVIASVGCIEMTLKKLGYKFNPGPAFQPLLPQ